jgi:hypothetical protein
MTMERVIMSDKVKDILSDPKIVKEFMLKFLKIGRSDVDNLIAGSIARRLFGAAGKKYFKPAF